jgi:FkbM family methyltransferase
MSKDLAFGAARRLDGTFPFVAERIRWQRYATTDMAKQVVESVVRRGHVVADIGANRGLWTARLVQLVGPKGRVHAFEPLPENEAHLLGVGRFFPRRLHVYPVGVSSANGLATLRTPRFSGNGRFGMSTIEPANTRFQHAEESITVPLVRLDDVLRTVRRLDFIKCDVEGHEDSVFEGATALLRAFKPTVVVELEFRHRGSRFDDVFERFAALGLDGYGVHRDGLRPVEQFNLDRDQLQWIEGRDDIMPDEYVNDFVFAARNVNLRALLA